MNEIQNDVEIINVVYLKVNKDGGKRLRFFTQNSWSTIGTKLGTAVWQISLV